MRAVLIVAALLCIAGTFSGDSFSGAFGDNQNVSRKVLTEARADDYDSLPSFDLGSQSSCFPWSGYAISLLTAVQLYELDPGDPSSISPAAAEAEWDHMVDTGLVLIGTEENKGPCAPIGGPIMDFGAAALGIVYANWGDAWGPKEAWTRLAMHADWTGGDSAYRLHNTVEGEIIIQSVAGQSPSCHQPSLDASADFMMQVFDKMADEGIVEMCSPDYGHWTKAFSAYATFLDDPILKEQARLLTTLKDYLCALAWIPGGHPGAFRERLEAGELFVTRPRANDELGGFAQGFYHRDPAYRAPWTGADIHGKLPYILGVPSPPLLDAFANLSDKGFQSLVYDQTSGALWPHRVENLGRNGSRGSRWSAATYPNGTQLGFMWGGTISAHTDGGMVVRCPSNATYCPTGFFQFSHYQPIGVGDTDESGFQYLGADMDYLDRDPQGNDYAAMLRAKHYPAGDSFLAQCWDTRQRKDRNGNLDDVLRGVARRISIGTVPKLGSPFIGCEDASRQGDWFLFGCDDGAGEHFYFYRALTDGGINLEAEASDIPFGLGPAPAPIYTSVVAAADRSCVVMGIAAETAIGGAYDDFAAFETAFAARSCSMDEDGEDGYPTLACDLLDDTGTERTYEVIYSDTADPISTCVAGNPGSCPGSPRFEEDDVEVAASDFGDDSWLCEGETSDGTVLCSADESEDTVTFQRTLSGKLVVDTLDLGAVRGQKSATSTGCNLGAIGVTGFDDKIGHADYTYTSDAIVDGGDATSNVYGISNIGTTGSGSKTIDIAIVNVTDAGGTAGTSWIDVDIASCDLAPGDSPCSATVSYVGSGDCANDATADLELTGTGLSNSGTLVHQILDCMNPTPANNPPTIPTISTVAVVEGVEACRVFSATDPEGDALSWASTGSAFPSCCTFEDGGGGGLGTSGACGAITADQSRLNCDDTCVDADDTTGHELEVDDGTNPAVASNTFAVTVTEPPPAPVTACTRFVDCFCDCMNDTDGAENNIAGFSSTSCQSKGYPIASSPVLFCEDFEAPTLYEDTGFGDGAPDYGPPYDNTGFDIYRGFNFYFLRKYTPGNAQLWTNPEPVSPTLGLTCGVSPGQQCGQQVWHPTDLWDGNDGACVSPMQTGYWAIQGITEPVRVGSHSGPFDGRGSYLMRNQAPRGSCGKHFDAPFGRQVAEMGVVKATAYPANHLELGSIWKHSEYNSPGVAPDAGWFLGRREGGNCGVVQDNFPFSGGMFSSGGDAACLAQVAAMTDAIGNADVACPPEGGMCWAAGAPDWVMSTDLPTDEWICVRAHMQLTGTQMRIREWFGTTPVLDITIPDASFLNAPGSGGWTGFAYNNYANAGEPAGSGINETTGRSDDNYIIVEGPPPACSDIGF